MINKKILLELMNDESFKQETIGLLNSLMDKEMEKSDDEIDFGFIEECSDAIIALTDGDEKTFLPVLLGSEKLLSEIRRKQFKKKIPAFFRTVAAAVLVIVVAYTFKNYYSEGIIPAVSESTASSAETISQATKTTSLNGYVSETVTESQTKINSEKATEKPTTEKESTTKQTVPSTTKPTTTERETTSKPTTARPTTTKPATTKLTTTKPATTKPTTTRPTTTKPTTTIPTTTEPDTQVTEPATKPTTRPTETTKPPTSENTNVGESDTVLSLRIVRNNLRSEYKKGEEPEFDDVEILVIYYDGSTEKISGADCDVRGFDSQTVGQQTITLRYKTKSVEINLNVIE